MELLAKVMEKKEMLEMWGKKSQDILLWKSGVLKEE